MSVSVTMPRLGESVTEGTVTRWLKHEGDQVEADEPLLEVSTDKVDTEVPSPASGVLTSIKVQEDETVDIGVELAVIGDAAGEDSSAPAVEERPAEPEPEPEPAQAPPPSEPERAPAADPCRSLAGRSEAEEFVRRLSRGDDGAKLVDDVVLGRHVEVGVAGQAQHALGQRLGPSAIPLLAGSDGTGQHHDRQAAGDQVGERIGKLVSA